MNPEVLKPSKQPMVILMAEDDADDCLLAKEALAASGLLNELKIVGDGVELIDYLLQNPPYTHALRPGLILLDMNMPRKNGREALAEIKTHAELKRIPVVILTTSQADEDIRLGYDLGASSYITKPVSFEGLVTVMQNLGNYWLEIVRLPEDGPSLDTAPSLETGPSLEIPVTSKAIPKGDDHA